MKKKSLHDGHRDRMRAKFSADAGAGLVDHELFEMLLYHAIPRRDTNETAHLLIERFGTLERTLDAPIEELAAVDGMTRNAAVLFSLVRELSRRYSLAKLNANADTTPVFDSADKIAAFLRPHYIGVTVERAYLLLFDANMHILDCRPLGDGSISNVLFSAREIAELAFRKRASHIVIAHNHPDGLATPSSEDLAVTRRLMRTLAPLELVLLEHFVFSRQGYCTIINQPNGYGESVLAEEEEPTDSPLLASTPTAFRPSERSKP